MPTRRSDSARRNLNRELLGVTIVCGMLSSKRATPLESYALRTNSSRIPESSSLIFGTGDQI